MGKFVETAKKRVMVALPLVVIGVVSYTIARYTYDRFLVERLNKSSEAIVPSPVEIAEKSE